MTKVIDLPAPQQLTIGKLYRLTWASNPNGLYKLIDYDYGGGCTMESESTGRRFKTQTKDLR